MTSVQLLPMSLNLPSCLFLSMLLSLLLLSFSLLRAEFLFQIADLTRGPHSRSLHPPAMAQYASFPDGRRLLHLPDWILRALTPRVLRQHALMLDCSIGQAKIGRAIPVGDHKEELIQYIISAQSAHLRPHLPAVAAL